MKLEVALFGLFAALPNSSFAADAAEQDTWAKYRETYKKHASAGPPELAFVEHIEAHIEFTQKLRDQAPAGRCRAKLDEALAGYKILHGDRDFVHDFEKEDSAVNVHKWILMWLDTPRPEQHEVGLPPICGQQRILDALGRKIHQVVQDTRHAREHQNPFTSRVREITDELKANIKKETLQTRPQSVLNACKNEAKIYEPFKIGTAAFRTEYINYFNRRRKHVQFLEKANENLWDMLLEPKQDLSCLEPREEAPLIDETPILQPKSPDRV